MAIQTFVADTILTAAQMNALQGNDYNQTVNTSTASYVLVASDKGTRRVMNAAGSTTITVNTSLFAAGDTLTILNIGAGVTTVTAGTATVSSAGSLALSQYASGTLYFTSAGVAVFQANGVAASASGLTFISATTVGTTVASVTVSSAFSATYDNYRVSYSGGVSSASVDLGMTLGATTTGYSAGLVYASYATGTPQGANVNNGASWSFAGVSTTSFSFISCDIFRPFASDKTQIVSTYTSSANGGTGGGFLNNTTSYTAFTITPASGTLTGGTIRVYGYQNS